MNALLFPLAFVSPAVFLAFLLGLKENNERPVFKALALGLCAGIAFYGMRCDETTDIYRHIALLSAYDTTFLGCFDAGHYGGLFVWDMWCWVIEKIGDPYLLQSSAAFVGYAIIGYICIDYSTCQSERQAGWVVPFLFAVCAIPVFPLVAGIRSTIAVLICALAFYLYNMKGCPILVAVLLDVMAVMIHQVALFPFPLRGSGRKGRLSVVLPSLCSSPLSASSFCPSYQAATAFSVSFARRLSLFSRTIRATIGPPRTLAVSTESSIESRRLHWSALSSRLHCAISARGTVMGDFWGLGST